jgi:DNA-binding beta-propeller fold protein YncE
MLAATVLLGPATAMLGSVAHAGGSIRGYVLLPAQGRVALVNVDRAHVVGTISVPQGGGPIAASIDGTRVLVANTTRGLVTEIDGITGRHVRTISGLGRPVDIELVPGARGLVRPRYAVVADARGSVDVLDLRSGTLARRVEVASPISLAIGNGVLWVASAGRTRLSEFDLTDPPRMKLVARPHTDLQLVALAIDSAIATGVDGITRDGRFVQIDGVSLALTRVTRLASHATQLLAGYNGEVWAASPDGHVSDIRAASGKALHGLRAQPGSRFTIVGGWLAATHGDTLRMFDLGGNGSAGSTTRLPGAAGSTTFAVL